MTSKVYVQTWGCQMNKYDSSRMLDLLVEKHGAVAADSPEEADILILNTCSVREKAQEKVFSQLGRWRPLKTENPDLIIGVGGCVASQEGAAIRDRAPFVDLVFGPQTLHRLPDMITEARTAKQPRVDISFPEIEKFDNLPAPRSEGPTAFVSIMEGCSKYCSFCVVPYTRGEEISRSFDDVIVEVAGLAEQGVREITLLGQNVNAYRGPMDGGGTADLALLLHYVAEIDGIDRIRYTTSHPMEFSDSLVEAFGSIDKLANYLHLPVQSGSNRILALMKRGHERDAYLEKIRRIRSLRPDISLSSDFIVGYPGETDEDFEQTMDLIEQIRFDQAFSFVYSPRPGTPAAGLDEQVDKRLAADRLARLQSRIEEFAAEYAQTMVGTTQRVLVEHPSRRNDAEMAGRTSNNRWINFQAPAGLIGQFCDVTITAAMPNSLRGRLAG